MQSLESDESSWLAVGSVEGGKSFKDKIHRFCWFNTEFWSPPPQPALALSCPWEPRNSLHFRNKHRTRRRWAASGQPQSTCSHNVISAWNDVMQTALLPPRSPSPPSAALHSRSSSWPAPVQASGCRTKRPWAAPTRTTWWATEGLGRWTRSPATRWVGCLLTLDYAQNVTGVGDIQKGFFPLRLSGS